MNKTLEIVSCSEMSRSQLENVRTLVVSENQVEFGGTFSESLDGDLADNSETVQGYCFLRDGEPIGIVTLKRPPSTADWVPANAVSLHGFKIDMRWQGQGLGGKAFGLAVQAAALRWPEAEQLVLAVDADNTTALAVYRSFGMTDSGPVYAGRIGQEHRLSMVLRGLDVV
ncbi:GNAT family N-acetyltransferase [Roseobacter weihaiensis]|uniref:GNAT family N-acetyltransferase n=1 Tax=Roseobacter weihaiensis TaxID=2763262 RepID=UPI001D09CC34|nr:GNAT family N-acetyltransferase [Roseobacter sp. H9]